MVGVLLNIVDVFFEVFLDVINWKLVYDGVIVV